MINIGITIAAPTITTLNSFSNASNPIDQSELKKCTIFQTTSIGVQPRSVITMPTRIEKTSNFITTRPGVSPRNELSGFDIFYPSRVQNKTINRFQRFKVQSAFFQPQDYNNQPQTSKLSKSGFSYDYLS